jgi:cullin-associated NEDD8-dissociated protein 1
MASLAVGLILEKIASKDKDFRYMATSDLLNELQKDTFKADGDTERKVSQIVLQQLDDASGDISGLAVKCLAPLVKKVNENRVVDIAETLCNRLLTGKEQQRDIASIALKTVVAEISSGACAQALVQALTPRLIKGITSQDTSTEVKSECLDILCDVLHRFGGLMVDDHELLLNALLMQLNLQRAGLRKRAIQCLATLASSMSDDLLARATVSVVQLLKNKDVKADMTRTNIQMIGALCRAVGYRFGPHLNEVVPLLISYCENASENDDELRENSLQALESFVLRCPRNVSEHTGKILDLALEYLSYDPNFTDDMDEDLDDDMDGEEEEDE